MVIAYGSKKLTKSQLKWPSTKGELYAGMYWVVKYGTTSSTGRPSGGGLTTTPSTT